MSRGEEAARWLAEHGGSCRAAGVQFGVSREAVRQWWRLLYGETRLPSRAVGDRIVELAHTGKTAKEIAAVVGRDARLVYSLCYHRRVTLAHEPEKLLPWAAATAAVAAGAALIDAAVDHGVSEGRLAEKCREAGISAQVRGGGKRRNGRSIRAAQRVLRDGITQAEASRLERCSRATVCIAVSRLKPGQRTP